MDFLNSQGLRLHYRDRGSGVPVVLFHAFPLSGAMFAAQVTALSDQVRFVIPDLRGFGESGLGPAPSTMESLAEDVLLLLDQLDIRSAVVGGVSMGGYVALALLRRDPSRVRGLVLADTQVGADDGVARAARETLAQDVLRDGMQVLVDRQLPRLLAPTASSELRRSVESMMRATSAPGAAAALRGMAIRDDSRDILARFSGPLLVVVGAEDALTPPEKARTMASLVPDAVLVEIPGAGHLANLEAPERFSQVLQAFLNRF